MNPRNSTRVGLFQIRHDLFGEGDILRGVLHNDRILDSGDLTHVENSAQSRDDLVDVWPGLAEGDGLGGSGKEIRADSLVIRRDEDGLAVHHQPYVSRLQRKKVERIDNIDILQPEWNGRDVLETAVEDDAQPGHPRHCFIESAGAVIRIE